MHIQLKRNTIGRGELLYRSLRYRKGHGIHSPFVYNLITKVIEEHCPYYRFNEIELLRRQLLQKTDLISLPDNKDKIRERSISDIVRRKAISPKHGALLFRLTHYFKSNNILQIGSSMGLSTLYLTSYKPDMKCTSLENRPEFASISQWVYDKGARTAVNLKIGEYKQLLPGVLQDMGVLDFVFFNTKNEQNTDIGLFNECIKYSNQQTVFVFEGIKANRSVRNLWKDVCSHPEVTVSIDLYSIGIAFLNKKLHKRNYIVYF